MKDQRIEQIKALAAKHNWRQIDLQEVNMMISFARAGVRMNVWWTRMTVATCLLHRKQGNSQLFRRDVSMDDIERIFINPRVHTGKGYYSANTKSFVKGKQHMPDWDMKKELTKNKDPRAVIRPDHIIEAPIDERSPIGQPEEHFNCRCAIKPIKLSKTEQEAFERYIQRSSRSVIRKICDIIKGIVVYIRHEWNNPPPEVR
jgi:hypothetical protein